MNSSRKGREERQGSREKAGQLGSVCLVGKTVYNSFDSVFEMNLPEVDEEAKLALAQSQLGDSSVSQFRRSFKPDVLKWRPHPTRISPTPISNNSFAPFAVV